MTDETLDARMNSVMDDRLRIDQLRGLRSVSFHGYIRPLERRLDRDEKLVEYDVRLLLDADMDDDDMDDADMDDDGPISPPH